MCILFFSTPRMYPPTGKKNFLFLLIERAIYVNIFYNKIII